MKIKNYEPKRIANFIVKFQEELNIIPWTITSITKPKYINYSWCDIEINFIDPIIESTSMSLFNLHKLIKTRKFDRHQELFKFQITSLDPTGVELETWEIIVGDVILIDFGKYDYSSTEIQTPKLIIKPLNCILK